MAPALRHTRNADLAKYKKAGALEPSPSAADKLLSLVLRLLIVALWKSVKALSVPFGKLFAVYFWLGKSVVSISLWLEKLLLRTVGWLSGTGFSRADSRLGRLSHYYLGIDVKRWHAGIVAIVLGSVVTTIVRRIQNSFDARVKQCMLLRQLMGLAKSYDEWHKLAVEVERLQRIGMPPLKEDYDRKLLEEKVRLLRRTRAMGNPREIMMTLRIDLIRNVANIAKSQKRHQNAATVPEPIQTYIKEVQEQLETIASWPESELPLQEKLAYFNVTRHAYGRTALLLSGGGGLGTFHLGVCKALFERNLLPRVLAGSSVGSIVCAILGVNTDPELKNIFNSLDDIDIGFFQNSNAVELVRHMVSKGHMQDISFMTAKLRHMLGDMTFQEAYDRTGRILNITVCPADTNEPARLLNYMTAPNVIIWSAVAASSSFPGLYPPQNLYGRNSKGEVVMLHGKNGMDTMERRWRDGSLEFDLPVQTLGELFNCNHFLVSQTNPHIVPLVLLKNLLPYHWSNVLEAEIKHRLSFFQWILPEWMGTRYLTLFTQQWEGDITFSLPFSLLNLAKTVVNPSKTDLVKAVGVGEHVAWARMAAIHCNCTIEAALDKCTSRLKRQAGAQGMKSMAAIGGRLPSWLHMPAMPMQTRHSKSIYWGDMVADNDGEAMASWGEYQDTPEVHSPAHQRYSGYGGTSAINGWRSQAHHLSTEALDRLTMQETASDRASDDIATATHLHPPTSGTRLAPIASSQSSHSDEEACDSASSVLAASAPRPEVVQHSQSMPTGMLRRTDTQRSGSAGISRKSSVVRNLHSLADEHSGSAVVKQGGGNGGMGVQGSQGASISPPTTRSNRSSISDASGGSVGDTAAALRRRRSGLADSSSSTPPPPAHPPVAPSRPLGTAHTMPGMRSAASLGPDGTAQLPPVPPPAAPPLSSRASSGSPPPGGNKGAHSTTGSGKSTGARNSSILLDLLPIATTCELAEQKQAAALASGRGSMAGAPTPVAPEPTGVAGAGSTASAKNVFAF